MTPIDVVELVRVRLPLRRELASAHGTESAREVVLVRMIDEDGVEGWGECSALELPTYTGEYTDGAWAVLRDHLVPAFLHQQRTGRISMAVRGHPMAEAAVWGAQLDLSLRAQGTSMVATLASAFGGDASSGLAWTAVVGIPTPARAASVSDAVSVAVAAGATALKVKIAPSAGCDVGLSGLIEAFPGLPIAADGNTSFWHDRDELVSIAQLLAASGPAGNGVGPTGSPRRYVEQPLEADDLLGHAALAETLAVPIALDESIDSTGDLTTAWHLGAGSLVNVKPARLGGLHAALALFGGVEEAQADVEPRERRRPHAFLGGMLETGVGRATALIAGVLLGLDATDLGPSSWYFEDDLTEPIELAADGLMHAPTGPGIGVTPRPDRLAEVTVDRLVIR